MPFWPRQNRRRGPLIAVGGAQAVAALTYGAGFIPRVDKLVGPGNAYVAAAKRLVYGRVNIDMVAGPSEVLVIADGSLQPRFGGGGSAQPGGARQDGLRRAPHHQRSAGRSGPGERSCGRPVP